MDYLDIHLGRIVDECSPDVGDARNWVYWSEIADADSWKAEPTKEVDWDFWFKWYMSDVHEHFDEEDRDASDT